MNKAEVVESAGVVYENGKIIYHVAGCAQCGACVTLTVKQRYDGTFWVLDDYFDEVLGCCPSPCYYWGDFKGFYKGG